MSLVGSPLTLILSFAFKKNEAKILFSRLNSKYKKKFTEGEEKELAMFSDGWSMDRLLNIIFMDEID